MKTEFYNNLKNHSKGNKLEDVMKLDFVEDYINEKMKWNLNFNYDEEINRYSMLCFNYFKKTNKNAIINLSKISAHEFSNTHVFEAMTRHSYALVKEYIDFLKYKILLNQDRLFYLAEGSKIPVPKQNPSNLKEWAYYLKIPKFGLSTYGFRSCLVRQSNITNISPSQLVERRDDFNFDVANNKITHIVKTTSAASSDMEIVGCYTIFTLKNGHKYIEYVREFELNLSTEDAISKLEKKEKEKKESENTALYNRKRYNRSYLQLIPLRRAAKALLDTSLIQNKEVNMDKISTAPLAEQKQIVEMEKTSYDNLINPFPEKQQEAKEEVAEEEAKEEVAEEVTENEEHYEIERRDVSPVNNFEGSKDDGGEKFEE